MNESYVECLVVGKPNTWAKALRILLFVIAFLCLAAIFFGFTAWLVLVTIGGVIGGIFIGQYGNVEYEYLYLDKELTVDKIYNQSKRKRVGRYAFDKIEVVAPIKSYHLDNFGKIDVKPKDYSIGFEDKPDLRYVLYYDGPLGKEKIIFSPSEELVKAMKNASPRKVFND